MGDLRRLREAVEAGRFGSAEFDMFVSKFPGVCAGGLALQVMQNECLNSAKALHEALLPEFDWLILKAEGKFRAVVAGPGKHEDGFEGEADNPARAWLLAQLRALEARGGENE